MQRKILKEKLVNAFEAANHFLHQYYPDCIAAFLVGSVTRDETTATSDLDILIFTSNDVCPLYNKPIQSFGWYIDAYVLHYKAYIYDFEDARKKRLPMLLRMCIEGRVMKDQDGLAQQIKDNAQKFWEQGPMELMEEQISNRRMEINSLLDDFIGSENSEECLFVASELVIRTAILILALNGQWSNISGKWIPRTLRDFNPDLADRLISSLKSYYLDGRKADLVEFVKKWTFSHPVVL